MASEKEVSHTGAVSFVFGFLSICFLLIPIFGSLPGMILAIFGFVFSIVQFRKGKNSWAVSGIILSTLGIVLNALAIYWAVSMIIYMKELIDTAQSMLGQTGLSGLVQ